MKSSKNMEHLKSFDKSFWLPKFALLVSGINIYSIKWSEFVRIALKFTFYFNIFWLYTDVYGELCWIIEGIQLNKSISELSITAPCTTICFLATAKSTPLFLNSKLLNESIAKLRKLHENVIEEALIENGTDIVPDVSKDITKTELNIKSVMTRKRDVIYNEQEPAVNTYTIIKDAIKFLSRVSWLLFTSSIIVVIAFCFGPMVVMFYELYTKGETELFFPFLTKYYFDTTKTKLIFGFMYFHQVWSTFIAFFNVFGSDSLLYAFCIYIQMHFKILCYNYEIVVTDSPLETRLRLKKCVKRHHELIQLVDQIEILYSKSTLFNILSSSLLICLSGFNVTFADDLNTFFAFLNFLLMSTFQIFLLCLFGDMLMQTSAQVADSIYKSRWYEADKETKKGILIVVIRSQKPCKLTAANFANLNLSAFTTILSRSWSYFALLRTMYK